MQAWARELAGLALTCSGGSRQLLVEKAGKLLSNAEYVNFEKVRAHALVSCGEDPKQVATVREICDEVCREALKEGGLISILQEDEQRDCLSHLTQEIKCCEGVGVLTLLFLPGDHGWVRQWKNRRSESYSRQLCDRR